MQAIRSLSRGVLIAAACALSLQAQCFDANTGAAAGTGIGDDVVLAAQTLPFAFPFNGSTYTTVHPCTNGFVYLSNGTTTGTAIYPGSVAGLTGAVSPMVAPWWSDLNMVSGTGSVKFFSSAAKANITWENAIEFSGSTATGQFTVQLQLYPSGDFDFVYDSRVAVRNAHTFLTGMSPGAGAVAGAAANFNVTGVGATDTNYQLSGPANGPVAFAGKGIHFVPTAPGFVWVPTICSANHSSYGTGCYRLNASFYENFLTAASFDLAASSMTMLASGSGYTMLSGLASYVAPTGGATALVLTDDSQVTVPLTGTFAYPGGSTSALTVCSNGFVSVAVGNGTGFTPVVATMLAATQTGWWSWHDFNPTIAGSGQVKFEQVGSIAYVTWDAVYSFATTNPETMQFQFDLSTGSVSIVWTTIGGFGNGFLVGYSPGGASNDPGNRDLSVDLPLSFSTYASDSSALLLAAAPNPISTAGSGTLVTYTTSNIPEFLPTSGLYIAINIMSLGQIPGGLDLGFIGAPGCAAYVPTLDLTQSMVGITSTQTVTLAIPAGIPAGTVLYSQSAALITPNSLPNGQNTFGMTTSNGITSFIMPQ